MVKKKIVTQTQSALLPDVVPDFDVVTKLNKSLSLFAWHDAVDPLHVLNLGGGRQSSALYLKALDGEWEPRPHLATMADTGAEPKWVYEQVRFLKEENDRRPIEEQIPIYIVKAGGRYSIRMDALMVMMLKGGDLDRVPHEVIDAMKIKWGKNIFRWNGPPAYTDGGAPLKRTCTSTYKILPQEEFIASYLQTHPEFKSVVNWRGHSMNEVRRAHDDDRPNWFTRHPLLESRLSDEDLAAWTQEKYGITFRWSACWCCPFILRSPERVRGLALHDLESFQRACHMDNMVRKSVPRTTSDSTWLSGPGRELDTLHNMLFGPRGAKPEQEDEILAGFGGSIEAYAAHWRQIAVEQFGEEWIRRFLGKQKADDNEPPLFLGLDMDIAGITYCDDGNGSCGL